MPETTTDHDTATAGTDSARIEQLWEGEFGDAYLHRNIDAAAGRAPFWDRIMTTYPATSVLEIGCTQGDNLVHIARHVDNARIAGVDINTTVLEYLERNVPGVRAIRGVARDLPLDDDAYDLVFTVGLLIHLPDESLVEGMAEIVRCARRWVLCAEYHADEDTTIQYRGHDDVLFKRDYGRLYTDHFPQLRLVEEGYLTKDEGFDRVTYQVFEKQAR